LVVYDDGGGPALYAGGDFTVAGGVAANFIARWDGSSWSPLGCGVNGEVHALGVYDDGGGPALYAGGAFTIAGNVTARRIAKWDGSGWSAIGSMFGISGNSSTVEALAVHDDGGGPSLYAGGRFTRAGGVPANYIAKWDGSSWSALGSGMSDEVGALVVHDDGGGPALYAGGAFLRALDSGDSQLAKWGYSGIDLDSPKLSCPSFVVVGDDLGSPPGEVVSFSVTASDCRDPSPGVVCVPPSGSFFPRGTTLVSCTATDASGNESTCQFPVTVAPQGASALTAGGSADSDVLRASLPASCGAILVLRRISAAPGRVLDGLSGPILRHGIREGRACQPRTTVSLWIGH
jgi:hypothetical protein